MSKYSIEDTTLTAIADAIREKGSTTDPILAEGMAAAIAAIETGANVSALGYTDAAFGTVTQNEEGTEIDFEYKGNTGCVIFVYSEDDETFASYSGGVYGTKMILGALSIDAPNSENEERRLIGICELAYSDTTPYINARCGYTNDLYVDVTYSSLTYEVFVQRSERNGNKTVTISCQSKSSGISFKTPPGATYRWIVIW